jgi:YfiR/HmsC-like
LGLFLCYLAGLARAESSTTFSADEVKAAYLVNFIRFTEWPPGVFKDNAPMVIGVVGNPELEDALWRITDGKLLLGRKTIVRRINTLVDASTCHLLYIHPPSSNDTSPVTSEDWLQAVTKLPALTVSEKDEFLQKGGVINFYTDGKKLRFEISPRAAEQVGLRLSSRLLALARIANIEQPHPLMP